MYVNDQLKGTTPVSYDFQWYGWHRVTVIKPGFERHDDRVLLKSPAYLWIPLDLVMELLPFPIQDTKELSYELTARAEPRTPSLPIAEPPATPEGTK